MGATLDKSVSCVGTMMQRAVSVLKEQNLPEDSFLLQFALYRNYNSEPQYILESSQWECDPAPLRQFLLEKAVCRGGWVNEAVEVGLAHARTEFETDGLDQVILIGDAAPNTEQEVERKRKHTKQDFTGTKFETPTNTEAELEFFKAHGIPIHTYYLDPRAKEEFAKIAAVTGGKCSDLEVDSPSSAEDLTGLVTTGILHSVGGESLVEAYKKTYRA